MPTRLMLALALAVAFQTPHRLERLPRMALLAEGRVVESAPGSLVIEVHAASLDGGAIASVQRIGLELEESDGYVFFLEADEEVSLDEGLRRVRPGDWVEVAPMPEHEFSKWKVLGQQGSSSNAQPGSVDRLMQPRTRVENYGVRGWTYIWVINERRR